MRGHRWRLAAAMLAALAALPVLTGCVQLRSDRIPDWVPAAARPTTPTAVASTEKEPAKGQVVVYLVKDGKLARVARDGNVSQTSSQQVLETLFAGPSASEAGAGFSTAVPEGTAANEAALDFGGIARVDLSREFAADASGSVKLRLAQVVFTLMQIPGTQGVVIRIEGKPVEHFGSERYRLMRPLGKNDFADVAGGS